MLRNTCQKPLQLSNYISSNISINKEKGKTTVYFLLYLLFVCLEMKKILFKKNLSDKFRSYVSLMKNYAYLIICSLFIVDWTFKINAKKNVMKYEIFK